MKFEEFKKIIKRREELVRLWESTRKDDDRKIVNEVEEINKQIWAVRALNPDVFNVPVNPLTSALNALIDRSEKEVDVEFKTMGEFSNLEFVMDIIEPNPKCHRAPYHRYYKLGPTRIDEQGRICVNLEAMLILNTINYRPDAVYRIPGFEDTVWEVFEEHFKSCTEERISLLKKICERNEEQKRILLNPEAAKNAAKELDEESDACLEKIHKLDYQL